MPRYTVLYDGRKACFDNADPLRHCPMLGRRWGMRTREETDGSWFILLQHRLSQLWYSHQHGIPASSCSNFRMQIWMYSLLDFTWFFSNREISERKKAKGKETNTEDRLKSSLWKLIREWITMKCSSHETTLVKRVFLNQLYCMIGMKSRINSTCSICV